VFAIPLTILFVPAAVGVGAVTNARSSSFATAVENDGVVIELPAVLASFETVTSIAREAALVVPTVKAAVLVEAS
jgi:hypothetical protein